MGSQKEKLGLIAGNGTFPFLVLDAAVMLEAGWNQVCDWLVYIDVPAEIRLRRLASQRGWSAKEVEAREQAQMPLTTQKSRATYTVDNSGSPAETETQVKQLLRQWGMVTP